MAEPLSSEQRTALQNAIFLLKQSQARVAALEAAQREPIAIVGVGCRFPGAPNPDDYWNVLRNGIDAVREVPEDRYNVDDYFDSDPSAPGKVYTRWGGYLDGIDQFDADFFGISPREAVRMDPQQRMLTEVAWEALEYAGISPEHISGSKAGVYIGIIYCEYGILQAHDLATFDVFSGTGSTNCIAANRLSYLLNLHGPSLALDTACSSSLVAVHLACQSLRRRETDLALAGGVNLLLGPEMTIGLCRAQMMSPDGRCKTFDASANGYVRGEGCGIVILKRLSDAQRDGDRILAVIRGTAVNHDGRSNGISAPSGPAQEEVLRAALQDAGVHPHDVSFVEAHGTGTRLGDPIETEALSAVLCQDRPADRPLYLGSVKTNIGHLEGAAGIAGLIKSVLMLQHREIPPHLHLREINPLLKIDGLPIKIPTQLEPWKNGDQPLRMGTSSFGFGGTNAHVILEEAPPAPAPEETLQRPLHVMTLSARTSGALDELAGRYAKHLAEHLDESLANIAYTANVGRAHFNHRLAVVAADAQEAQRRLAEYRPDALPPGMVRGEATATHRVAMLFTGQGSQYAGMGRALYETQPEFRSALDQCAQILDDELDRPLLELLAPTAGDLLNQTGFTQPAIFALQYALATLWRSWGIEPAAVMGHSVGEFAAACIAGVLSLEDGLRLIAARARLMQQLPAGGVMAAVLAGESQVKDALGSAGGEVSIAAYNGPKNIVIAGPEAAVQQVLDRLAADGVQSKRLATSHAFHSALIEPAIAPLVDVAASMRAQPPQIPIIANLTGTFADEQTYADPEYWGRHARQPVQFATGIQTLITDGCDVLLEIGPSPTLIGMGQRIATDPHLVWLSSLRPGRDEWRTMLTAAAELYVRGLPMDWRAFDRPYARRRVALPTYPFQRRRYWTTAVRENIRTGTTSPLSNTPERPLLGRPLTLAIADKIFQSEISARRPALLADHKVQSHVIAPGSAWMEMGLAAGISLKADSAWRLESVIIQEPLLLSDTPLTLQTLVSNDGGAAYRFRIMSMEAQEEGEPIFTAHAEGRLRQLRSGELDGVEGFNPSETKQRFHGPALDEEWRAEALRRSGLEPGPQFKWLTLHWVEGQEAFGEMRAPREADQCDRFAIHPGLLDSCLQLLGGAIPGAGSGIDTYVPQQVESVTLYRPATGPTYCHARLNVLDERGVTGDIALVNEQGELILQMTGVWLRRVPRDWLVRLTAGAKPKWLYELHWTARPDAPSETVAAGARWLILDGDEGLGGTLKELLTQRGHVAEVLAPSTSLETLRATLASSDTPWDALVDLRGLDIGSTNQDGPAILRQGRERGWGALLDVVQVATDLARPPRVHVVTRGAVAAANAGHPIAVGQSPVWGLARVIAAEHPELAVRRIDLDPADTNAALLLEQLLDSGPEDQIALRGAQRYVARLRPSAIQQTSDLRVPHGKAHRLEIVARGELDDVELRAIDRRPPGPGEVELEVRATGLNFRDVLNVLNLYPGDPGPLGGECSGVVSAVGPDVTNVKPGDEVVALAPASFASHVTTAAEFVVAKPDHLSFREAATIPIAFVTAHYALNELGRIQSGQRVLIHAATGGVGHAAIQIARLAGAEIFATAGSPRKRAYLESLGIRHIMDSRTLEFASEIQQRTSGEGVHHVINSLTGASIERSLSVLAPGGHFLELGKTDLWDQKRVDEVRPGVHFHAIALDHMMADEPELVGRLLREVMSQFETKRLTPLPLHAQPITRVVSAMRKMARAEHIGKIVIDAAARQSDAAITMCPDATYLITGGLGGLGQLVARWLVDRGARHLVLVGRSQPGPEAQKLIAQLQAAGAHVETRSCDLGDYRAVAEMLDGVRAELPPLRGIFHLAGVLDDGVLREQTRERFDRVMAAKALGALYLDQLTASDPLEHFVLFSSAAALLGAPGQGNYAAANALLDGLAHHRRALNRPAISINWGSWSEAGMAARLGESKSKRISAAGVGHIDPLHGIESLEQIMAEDLVQVGVLPIDWPTFLQRIPAGAAPSMLADIIASCQDTEPSEEASAGSLLAELEQAAPGEKLDLLLQHLSRTAARVLAWDAPEPPDPRRPLNQLGFDSLTAVEFCNAVGRSLGRHVNPTVLFDHSTLEKLAQHLAQDVLQIDLAGASADDVESPPADEDVSDLQQQVLAEVSELDEASMEALINEQLEKLG